MAKIEPANLLLKDKDGNSAIIKSLTDNDLNKLKVGLSDVSDLKTRVKAIEDNGYVSYNSVQTLNEEQCSQAQANMDAPGLSANNTFTGNMTVEANVKADSMTLNTRSDYAKLSASTNDHGIKLLGGSSDTTGASIDLRGSTDTNAPNTFTISASNGVALVGSKTGSLTWNSENVVRKVNNLPADASGNVSITSVANATKASQDKNGAQIDTTYFKSANGIFTGTNYFRDVNNSLLRFNGGNTRAGGASLILFGKNVESAQGDAHGHFDLVASTKEDGSDAKQLIGTPTGILKWDSKNIVRSVNGVNADASGNVLLGTEKSTFNKVVYDTGYFSISTAKTYSFDLTDSDLENVSKENINVRLVAKVTTAHNGFKVGDIAQLSTSLDYGGSDSVVLDICFYIRGNTLCVYSGNNPSFSINSGTGWMRKSNVQIKAVLTAFVPDDGSILLIAEDQTNTSKLIGLPDGTLTWGGKTIAPVTGKIEWFAFNTPPEGYLVCNGANVSRKTYADLFNAIGTTFGEGDGSTTFALPNLIDRFAQGSTTVGTAIKSGLPNITGGFTQRSTAARDSLGCISISYKTGAIYKLAYDTGTRSEDVIDFNASRSSSIYGNSETVQPPALTLLPCIKY